MAPIKKEVVVDASQETSFKVFTEKIDQWWPKELHVGKAPLRESILEPKPSGRWYSTHEDGSEVTIGYIIDWNPFDRLLLAWQIDGNFTYDPDLVSEIEVTFIVDRRHSPRPAFARIKWVFIRYHVPRKEHILDLLPEYEQNKSRRTKF